MQYIKIMISIQKPIPIVEFIFPALEHLIKIKRVKKPVKFPQKSIAIFKKNILEEALDAEIDSIKDIGIDTLFGEGGVKDIEELLSPKG
ncbi:hypothetical protein ACRU1U_10820 [Providencia stuartii]|nr:hypothetical protein [Providencia stuartii]AIN62869.1 hypothetical protein DR96_2187 [Providencia stuartii]KNZ85756.1 hypothetical protein AFL46_08650 [Providencia stuartii]SPY60463.1 Uncharacterised protein [Providencia stuartii]